MGLTTLPALVARLPRPFRRHKLVGAMLAVAPRLGVSTFPFNETAIVTADVRDPEARQVMLTGVFEPEFFRISAAFLAAGTAMLDIGANAGFCTFGLIGRADVPRDVSYHVFEANPHLCGTLNLTRQLHPGDDVTINHACVTDRPGTARLTIISGHSGASFITHGGEGCSVPNVILDQYLTAERRAVSFAKLDIEGHEAHALRGLRGAIASGKIGALYIEVSPTNLTRSGTNPEGLLALGRELGCEWFWCRSADVERERATAREQLVLSHQPPLRLARVREFPADHQTDLVAIPRTGMYSRLLDSWAD